MHEIQQREFLKKKRGTVTRRSHNDRSSTDGNDKRTAWKMSAEGWNFMSKPKCPGDRINESRIV